MHCTVAAGRPRPASAEQGHVNTNALPNYATFASSAGLNAWSIPAQHCTWQTRACGTRCQAISSRALTCLASRRDCPELTGVKAPQRVASVAPAGDFCVLLLLLLSLRAEQAWRVYESSKVAVEIRKGQRTGGYCTIVSPCPGMRATFAARFCF